MKTKPNLSSAAAELRRRAEERLRAQHPENAPARSEADTQRLLHELQVHQIELEMQNEELQQARNQLEAGLEKYSDLYDFAPVGYLTLDPKGTVREANLTSASLLGIERARLVTRRFGLCLSAADQAAFNAFLARAFERKARESCEVTIHKEGKPPVEVRLEAGVAASGRECRVAVTDITERKQAEGHLLILSKLESTRILAGGIAHDFNNLLTVIVLNLEMAQARTHPGEELDSNLEDAKKAALVAHGLTRQLITFAKGDAPVLKPTRLSGAVIRESVRLALGGSRVRCEFLLPDDLWLAEVDVDQIGQVIRNLVLNAREAMLQGGVITVQGENVVLGPQQEPPLPPGDYVRLSIADQGSGIAKEVLPKVFDPYFSTKERGDQKGMGLGLTICHTIVQQHGGALAVESEAGVGTTFRIHLPASRKLPEEKRVSPPKALPRHGRILVMDDEEAVKRGLGGLLRLMGHTVDLAGDGQRAIELYQGAQGQGRPFDAVILDLTVRAGLGGQQALQALLKIDPAVKAIVMSGYTADPVVLEPERYGFKGVLLKPFDANKLRETLARVLGPESTGKQQ
jgi:PAS domain S-box-containing protein